MTWLVNIGYIYWQPPKKWDFLEADGFWTYFLKDNYHVNVYSISWVLLSRSDHYGLSHIKSHQQDRINNPNTNQSVLQISLLLKYVNSSASEHWISTYIPVVNPNYICIYYQHALIFTSRKNMWTFSIKKGVQ